MSDETEIGDFLEPGLGWRPPLGHVTPVCEEAADLRVALLDGCCEVMHDAYERAAVGAGWETNPASRKPWSGVPEANKATMRAAVTALLDYLEQPAPDLAPSREVCDVALPGLLL